jgi:ribosomal protein L19
MKIRKVKYAQPVPGKIERHCAAFLTQSGQVILVGSILGEQGIWPIFNSGDAIRLAKDIMEGKKKSVRIAPILQGLGVVAWESTKYDETLVAMAKAGQLINAVVIENVPDSMDELQRFAGDVLRAEALGK